MVEGADLAIDDRIGQCRCRLGDLGIFARPVESLPRLQCHLAIQHTQLDPIAVELDLMNPTCAGGRTLQSLAELRRNEIRQIDRGGRFRFPAGSGVLFSLFGSQSAVAIPDRISLNIAALDHERLGLSALAGGNLLHGTAGGNRGVILLQDRFTIVFDRERIVVFDQQPICPLAAVAIIAHAHQHEAAVQALALQGELEVAFCQRLLRALISFRFPIAPIPEHDRAAAVLTFRNGAFEVAIVQRVILDLDCQPLVVRVEGWAFGDSPGFKDAIELEPQVVVQPGGIMFLDDEATAIATGELRIAARLRRLLKVALRPIGR